MTSIISLPDDDVASMARSSLRKHIATGQQRHRGERGEEKQNIFQSTESPKDTSEIPAIEKMRKTEIEAIEMYIATSHTTSTQSDELNHEKYMQIGLLTVFSLLIAACIYIIVIKRIRVQERIAREQQRSERSENSSDISSSSSSSSPSSVQGTDPEISMKQKDMSVAVEDGKDYSNTFERSDTWQSSETSLVFVPVFIDDESLDEEHCIEERKYLSDKEEMDTNNDKGMIATQEGDRSIVFEDESKENIKAMANTVISTGTSKISFRDIHPKLSGKLHDVNKSEIDAKIDEEMLATKEEESDTAIEVELKENGFVISATKLNPKTSNYSAKGTHSTLQQPHEENNRASSSLENDGRVKDLMSKKTVTCANSKPIQSTEKARINLAAKSYAERRQASQEKLLFIMAGGGVEMSFLERRAMFEHN